MCFHRRSAGDIVLDGHKIVGSAQRRLRNALLQHGSILIKTSSYAPSLPGIHDLCKFGLGEVEISKELANSLDCRLKIGLIHGKLSKFENEAAKKAETAYFDNRNWNLGR